MPEETQYDKVKKANDDYHDAVQTIMLDESVSVKAKIAFAARANVVFAQMDQANEELDNCYSTEEE